MHVEWITFTPLQGSFVRPLLGKTKSCAIVLQEKVGEESVIQDEPKKKYDRDKVKGTTKASN